MLKSIGLRFMIVGLLILLMSIPMLFVGDIIDARADYNRATRISVGQEWGGEQSISGPALMIPVEETVIVQEKRIVIDPETGVQRMDADNNPIHRFVNVTRTLSRDPIYLYPNRFDAVMDTVTEERARGIFSVPVYTAKGRFAFDFPTDRAAEALVNDEVPLWDKAELLLSVTTNRALRGVAMLRAGETVFQMEPRAMTEDRIGGVRAPLGDPRGHGNYELSLAFNGAGSLQIAPTGRMSQITLSSDWPDPSFSGAFLPDSRDISEDGFKAQWSIPHLARPLPQISRKNQDYAARAASFGVDFYQPNDFYQKSYRAARYGILFIGLSFLTIFLIEGQARRPTHPVQYILVGLAQSTFFLLMLALAEQMGFGAAYAISAGATILLIAAFGALALQLGRRALVLGLMLTVLYGVLYLILRAADYALLAGAILTFGAIAGTMFATRNENWYGAPRTETTRRGWFGRTAPATPPAPPAPPGTT